MDTGIWDIFLNLDLLLVLAVILGILFERFRQSAIIGYLVAGMLIGPGGLRLVEAADDSMHSLAELGVALLLFTIGLEFSIQRLRAIGRFAILGGTLQVALTAALFAGAGLALGLGARLSILMGILIAPSSTACVLRVLRDRAEIDSVHGRNATGILLLQDLALVPLVLIVSMLAKGGRLARAGEGYRRRRRALHGLRRSLLRAEPHHPAPPAQGGRRGPQPRDTHPARLRPRPRRRVAGPCL